MMVGAFLIPESKSPPPNLPLENGRSLLACLMQRDLAHLSNLFLPCFEGRLGGVGLPLDKLRDSSLAIALEEDKKERSSSFFSKKTDLFCWISLLILHGHRREFSLVRAGLSSYLTAAES